MKRKANPVPVPVSAPASTVLASFPAVDATDCLLCIDDVVKLTARKRSTVYSNIRKGLFPAPIHHGTRASRWKLSEIQAYINGTYTAPPAPIAPVLKLVRKGGKV